MAEAFAIISAAVGFAIQVESTVQSLLEDLKNVKEFGSSLEKARLEMKWEADRMKDMRILLFGQSDRDSIASGIAFGRFDRSTQLAILNILRRFSEFLALNYRIIDGRYSASEPTASMILNPAFAFESFQHGSLAKGLRWGFRDKKKIDKVLLELQSWNDRLFSRIQISYLRLEPGEALGSMNFSRPSLLMQSPQNLTNNREAKNLGLSNDASLYRLASASSSFQLTDLRIENTQGWVLNDQNLNPGDRTRRIARVGDMLLLLEYKEFLPDLEGRPTPAVERRVEQLANILHSQKSSRYHTLTCQGYFLEKEEQRFVFVFNVPEADNLASLTTLHQVFVTQKNPALEDRFILARTLAMSLSQLFAVGWVHKSFRSSNVLYFRNATAFAEDATVSTTKLQNNHH